MFDETSKRSIPLGISHWFILPATECAACVLRFCAMGNMVLLEILATMLSSKAVTCSHTLSSPFPEPWHCKQLRPLAVMCANAQRLSLSSQLALQSHRKTNLTKKYSIESKVERINCGRCTFFKFPIAPWLPRCPYRLHWQMVQISLYTASLDNVTLLEKCCF